MSDRVIVKCKMCGNTINIYKDLEPSRFYDVKVEFSEHAQGQLFIFTRMNWRFLLMFAALATM